ncbi:MAG: hypothetical protein COZ18_10395 [Flexibacter sp. CG_4_10_14_3_um_filter_32_15]|nr:MAG: hypothetical protein COZ18_10395 [Flexibacter sp. CG_4_10_14_3_um_filter_32_15]
MKITKNKLNRLKAFTPLLQTLLIELQEEIDDIFPNDESNDISDIEMFRLLLDKKASMKSKSISEGKLASTSSKIVYHIEGSIVPLYNYNATKTDYNDNQSVDLSELHKEKIVSFFRQNKELVDTVLFKEKYGKVKTCYIALKKDSTENRSVVFDFLEKYEQETQQSFLIQFIPLSFIEKFNRFTKINLD